MVEEAELGVDALRELAGASDSEEAGEDADSGEPPVDAGVGAFSAGVGCAGELSPCEPEATEGAEGALGTVEEPADGALVEDVPAGTEPTPVEPGAPDVPIAPELVEPSVPLEDRKSVV